MAEMINALANRNSPPKLVEAPVCWLPLYPADYDWKEEERVANALGKVSREKTAAMWEELVRHIDDDRYCRTLKDKNETFALGNWTVGRFCLTWADAWLIGVYVEHLPNDPNKDGYPLYLDLKLGNLKEWRKQRQDKQLYELQIEVCEKAIELLKVADVRQHEKDQAKKEIGVEIVTLRKTKRPIFTDYMPIRKLFFSAKEAAKIREELQKRKGAGSE
jgi:hypothetical protein